MRRFTAVLGVEGKSTTDGRVIARGALSWPDEPVPLTDQDGNRIGTIDKIERDGDIIRCEGLVDRDEGFGLGMSVKINHYTIDDALDDGPGLGVPTSVSIDDGEIFAAAVTDTPAFLEARARLTDD